MRPLLYEPENDAMQWLLAIETVNDPIPVCRLMNVFRRKSVRIVTLALAGRAEGYSMMALVETPEADVDHLFNFVRRTDGVEKVTSYRHQPSGDASFIFIDSEEGSASFARLREAFPESRLIFASHGKYLLEVPAGSPTRPAVLSWGEAEFRPFTRARTTEDLPRADLVPAEAR